MVKMIAICFLFGTLASTQAFAFTDPGAGSYENYVYSSQGATGKPTLGTQIDSVVSVTSSGQNFQLKTEVNLAGRVSQTALWNLSGNYFKNTEYFIEHCAETGGRVETLKVFAGSFTTCHILFHRPDQHTVSQEVWLSTEVPLFIVKQIKNASDSNQTRTTLELQDYKFKVLSKEEKAL